MLPNNNQGAQLRPPPPEAQFPLIPKGVYGLLQCAGYTKEAYVALLAREQGRSEEEVEASFAHFHGVEGFLELARQQKQYSDDNKHNVFVVGDGPQANEAVSLTHFPQEYNLVMRIWGFERLARARVFAFDFTDGSGKHVDTPRGMALSLSSLDFSAGTPICPVRTCMASALKEHGHIRDAIVGASEEVFGQETYLIEQGTSIQISYLGANFRVQIPVHPPPVSVPPGCTYLTATAPRIVELADV